MCKLIYIELYTVFPRKNLHVGIAEFDHFHKNHYDINTAVVV